MALTLQEWLAILIVVIVVAVALRRRWLRRKAACSDCAVASRCPTTRSGDEDDLRVLDVARQVSALKGAPRPRR